MDVKWNSVFSENFPSLNGVRKGGVLFPLLFSVYIDQMLESLRYSGCGLYNGKTFLGRTAYADGVVLLSSSMRDSQDMVDICCRFVDGPGLKFNPQNKKCVKFSTKPGFSEH